MSQPQKTLQIYNIIYINAIENEKVFRKIMETMTMSNRPAHILCVGAMSLLLGWAAGIASIISLEYKDVQKGGWQCWDWLDVLAGLIGCVIGGWLNLIIKLYV